MSNASLLIGCVSRLRSYQNVDMSVKHFRWLALLFSILPREYDFI